MKKKNKKIYVLIFILVFLLSLTCYKTGIFDSKGIDKRDLKKWEYNEDGLILGQGSFTLDGSTGHCWLVVHSYTSTPNEMKELATLLRKRFGEYVFVPRLKGHATLPSNLEGLSILDWYTQIEEEYLKMNEKCGEISFVGSSIGGSIGLKLSEEYDLYSVYMINTFLNIPYNFYYIFKPEDYMEFLTPYIHYIKKNKTGRIASPTGEEKHFAYLNIPLEPMVNSRSFLLEMKNNLSDIDEPIFITHSTKDSVGSFESVKNVYETISSKK